MVEQNSEEKFVFLEISGEQGDIETYKNALLDANALNIKRILLACIWDGQEEKGEELLKEVSKLCSVLVIVPFPSIGGYKKALYTDAMIGTIRKVNDTVIPDITNMISLKEYKKSVSGNKKNFPNAEEHMDIFMRKLENGELSHMEEPVIERHIATLDDEFIEKQVDSFEKSFDSLFMKIFDTATNKAQCLSLKNETTSNSSNITD